VLTMKRVVLFLDCCLFRHCLFLSVLKKYLEVGPYGPLWHTGTSSTDWKAYRHFFFLRKIILVCFAGYFVRFRQLVGDVCINHGQNSASLRVGMEGRHSNHTGTYFSPLRALKKSFFLANLSVLAVVVLCIVQRFLSY